MFYKKIILSMLVTILIGSLLFSPAIASCKIQGNKVYYSDNKELDGSSGPVSIFNSRVFIDSVLFSDTNPYFITVAEGNYVLNATVPAGYEVGYTLCYNNMACHTQTPVMLSKVPISCSSGVNSYIDLWWHYRKLGDIDNNKIVDLRDLIQMLKALFI